MESILDNIKGHLIIDGTNDETISIVLDACRQLYDKGYSDGRFDSMQEQREKMMYYEQSMF